MFLNPAEIINRISFPSGSRVGDFGTGSGQFALLVAEKLGPEATIYALDPLNANVEKVAREARATGANFFTLMSDLNLRLPLKNNLLTHAIVANTLYALQERAQFVSELARVVEPKGTVLVVDWLGSFDNMGPPQEQVMLPSDATQLFRNAGFNVGEMIPAGTHHFAFTAKCSTA